MEGLGKAFSDYMTCMWILVALAALTCGAIGFVLGVWLY